MQKPNLNKIIADNLDKAKFQSKSQPSLPTSGWLDAYQSGGGIYLSDRAKATQFGQYRMGGGMFPEYHSFAPPRMDEGGKPKVNLNLPVAPQYSNYFIEPHYTNEARQNVNLQNYGVEAGIGVSPRFDIYGGFNQARISNPYFQEKFKPSYNVGVSYRFDNGGDISIPDLNTDKWLMKYQTAGQVNTFGLANPRDLQRQMINASESTAPTNRALTTGVSKENMAATSQAMAKAGATEERLKQQRIAERKDAKAFDRGNLEKFTFPNGQTKTKDQMDFRDRAYISGKATEGLGRFDENDETWYDEWANPIHWITSAAGALGTAPYEAKQSNSNLPYLTAIGTPLLMGRSMGSGSINPFGKKFWTNEVSNKEFLSNMAGGFPEMAENIIKNPKLAQAGSTLYDVLRAKDSKEALSRLQGIPLEKDLPRLSPENLKVYRQIQDIGRLRATGSSLADQMKHGLQNNLPEEHFQNVFDMSKDEAQHLLNTGFGERSAGSGKIDLRRNADADVDYTTQRIFENQLPDPPSEIHLNLDVPTEHNSQEDASWAEDMARAFRSNEQQTERDRLRAMFRNIDAEEATANATPPPTEYVSGSYSPDYARPVDRSQRVMDLMNSLNPQQYITDHQEEQVSMFENYVQSLMDRGNSPERASEIANEIMRAQVEGPRIEGERSLQDRWNNYVDRKQPTSQIINNKLKKFLENNSQHYPYYSGETIEQVPSLSLAGSGSLKNVSKKVNFAPEGIQSGDVFTGSTNTSHSSYLPQLKQVFKYTKGDPRFLGYKPMNTLGFLSQYGYKPSQIAEYLNTEIDEQIKRGILPKNIQRPYLKRNANIEDEGDYFSNHVMLPHYGVKQHKKGGQIITDPMGQWKYPGQNTRIPGGNITMQGVPYPVLAKASNGMSTMMYPGQQYSFPGASHVDEYPMMQNGGWLNKYELPKAGDGKEYQGVSIVDYLGTKGYPGDKNFRKELAGKYGIEDYDYSANKNIELLNKLRQDDSVLENIKPSFTPTQRVQAPPPPPVMVNPAVANLMLTNVRPTPQGNVNIPNLNNPYGSITGGRKPSPLEGFAGPNAKGKTLANFTTSKQKPSYTNKVNKQEEIVSENDIVKKQTKPAATDTGMGDVLNLFTSLPSLAINLGNKIANSETFQDAKSIYNEKGLSGLWDAYQNKKTRDNSLEKGDDSTTVTKFNMPVVNPKLNINDTTPLPPPVYFGKPVVDADRKDNNFYHAPMYIDLNRAKFGFKNRGGKPSTEQNGITETAGLVLTPFASEYSSPSKKTNSASDDFLGTTTIRKYKDSEIKDGSIYGGIDDEGNFQLGYGKDMKGKNLNMADFRAVETEGFIKDANGNYKLGTETGNKRVAKVPHIKTDEGETHLPFLVPNKGKDQDKTYGQNSGGKIVIATPDFKEKILVGGSLRDVDKALEDFKAKHKLSKVKLIVLDNGTYSRGFMKKGNKISSKDWSKYEVNSSGGAGFYLKGKGYKTGGSVNNSLNKYQVAGEVDPMYYNVSMGPLSDNTSVRRNTKQGPKDLVSTASTINGLYGAVKAGPKQEGRGETILNTTGKILDPTGISSWADAGEAIGNAYDNPGFWNITSAGLNTLGALPFVHYLGAAGKALTGIDKAAAEASNLSKLQKVRKYAGKTLHYISGEPVINVIDKATGASKLMPTANQLLTGFNKANRFWGGVQGYSNAALNKKYGGQTNWLDKYK